VSCVFEAPSPPTEKRPKTKNAVFGFKTIEKKRVCFVLSIILQKKNSTRLFCKTFFVVFLNSHRREAPENAIKQQVEEKLTSK
jgi:hypothetical protein